MELKKLRETQEKLVWPNDSDDLPVISWDSCTSSSILPIFPFLTVPIGQSKSKLRSDLSFSFPALFTTSELLLMNIPVAHIC